MPWTFNCEGLGLDEREKGIRLLSSKMRISRGSVRKAKSGLHCIYIALKLAPK